jgi:hypothetical protein
MENRMDEVIEALKDIKAAVLFLIATNIQIRDSLPQPLGTKPTSLSDALAEAAVLFQADTTSPHDDA